MGPTVSAAPTITFQRESVAAAWDEALPLMRANNAEAGALPNLEFAPDRAKFETSDAFGILRAFTARLTGVLIGYALFCVSPHLHYAFTKWAVQDVLYVAPAHRGRAAIRFIRWQDQELAAEGVDLVYRHVTVRNNYSPVLLRMGYHAEEQRFVRDLRPLRRAS